MIVQHLLEVSVCLLGVCLILCLAASLTPSLIRRYPWKGLDLQNVRNIISYITIYLIIAREILPVEIAIYYILEEDKHCVMNQIL